VYRRRVICGQGLNEARGTQDVPGLREAYVCPDPECRQDDLDVPWRCDEGQDTLDRFLQAQLLVKMILTIES
jgi:hypothetical protein